MRYYTSGDIAKLCGVSRPTASNWIARGKLPTPEITTVGGMLIWSEDQALAIRDDYLDDKKRLERISKLRAELKALEKKRKQ